MPLKILALILLLCYNEIKAVNIVRKCILTVLIGLMSVCLFGCNAMVITPKNNDIYDYTIGGESIYYAEGNKIYKEDENGSTVIYTEDAEIFKLQAYKDNLYYGVLKDLEDGISSFDIRSVSFDGKENKTAIKGRDKTDRSFTPLNDWCIYEGYLYLQFYFEFYQVNLKNGSMQRLHDDVRSYQLYDNHLYYVEHSNRTFTIYKINLRSKKVSIVLGNGETEPSADLYYNFRIADTGEMIYTKRAPWGIYMYAENKHELIEAGNHIDEESLTYDDGRFYYTTEGDNAVLKRYDIASKCGETVSTLDDYKSMLAVKNGYCYYKTTTDEVVKIAL